MVPAVSHDSSPPAQAIDAGMLEADPTRGFVILIDGCTPMCCGDVQGFDEAETAAYDPRAPMPLRVCVISPDAVAAAWLERWAEDAEYVRRRMTIRAAGAGVGITIVATIASFGHGVATSLAVESILALGGDAPPRSGVHPRAWFEAALARRGDRGDYVDCGDRGDSIDLF
jgi:hypothetical protein